MNFWLEFLILFLLGYGAGSLPFGLILTKIAGLGDIRKIGSGNIGATNVLRTGNKKIAAIVLLLDMVKGIIAILIASYGLSLMPINGDMTHQQALILVGLASVLGHNFPIWLGFKGGKGVATSLGVILILHWPVGLITLAIWLGVAVIFRYSSLAALIGIGLSPALALWFGQSNELAAFYGLLALLSFVRHRQNIHRLVLGQESKIKLKRSA